ncbi:MAG: ABC transporter substrate-binding protein [Candidatus Acidiferrales bacterium]
MLRRLAVISALAAVAFAALPARSARRPRHGGTLRVEIGASVASLDPDVEAATAEEAAAKWQIDSLIFDHRDADGEFAGAAGSGPFRVTAFEAGKRAVLAANEVFREGRPFVDAVEIAMGRGAHERLVDLELNKTDFAQIPPQDARRAAELGVRVSASQPDELLALVFVSGNAAATSSARTTSQAPGHAAGQALSLAIDRVAIVNFILQKTGEAAGGLLPQWSSGTAFLFPAGAPTAADLDHTKELWKEIAAARPLVLGYDSADPLEQSVAERIVVNAKEAGMAVRAQAIPDAGAGNSRAVALRAAHVDVELVRWRMTSPLPVEALRSILLTVYLKAGMRADEAPFPADPASPEDIYKLQREVWSTHRVVPLVWLPQVYGLSARVRDWKAPGPGENWPLADVWLDTETPTGVQ